MTLPSQSALQNIIEQFALPGEFLDVTLVDSGHINDTFASRFQTEDGVVRFIHQRVNTYVFRNPVQLMENVARVTRHARECIVAAGGDPQRETLNLVLTREGETFHVTPEGDYWRTYLFVEGARTYATPIDLDHVRNAARAFGNFQKLMSSLPGEPLHETIPNFHHTPTRFQAFLTALDSDPANRATSVRDEIEFVLERGPQTSVVVDLLDQGCLPRRVTHNDTKLNNVLIDDRTRAGICVIDLDTVMPGSVLYDFGDSVRAGASTGAEDEPNLDRVGFSLELFDCLASGYLESAREFLTPSEIDHLPFAGILITLEQAIRFLGDYLNGDVYYKVHRPGQNLDRARTQLKLVAEMERHRGEMERIVARYR